MNHGSSFHHGTWLSPFTWRYGRMPMRRLWSEQARRQLWRRLWCALAEAQSEVGLVTEAQLHDLRRNVKNIDIDKALAIEAEIHHDLMAEVKVYASQCPEGGGIIHLGATSMDIEDNADALRLREALTLTLTELRQVLDLVAQRIEQYADHATMGFTHLQPAEPTTIGYRLAQYGWDLLTDYRDLVALRDGVYGKGFKGAVGTSASYAQLLAGSGRSPAQMEARVMGILGLPPAPVATQVAPRKQEYRVLAALASLGQSLYRFAADLRLLQSPPIGEWAEPFGKKQVGSSAMPFKRNPINAENMDSLARQLASYPRIAWDNAAHCYLERTLDDSGNRRSILPEAFLIADELLRRAQKLMGGLVIDGGASQRLLATYGPFAATERVMMELVRRGGNRQELHHIIREHSLAAWAVLRQGGENPLEQSLVADERLTALATSAEIQSWLVAADYVGDAPERARAMAGQLRETLNDQ